ncbi:hypothetical protein [Streptomyces sp. NPDC005890]|uniref:hypothetical protein n=1 Tax=Streptomyces sp. NPDC005890 TaxID=3154568 RepID=UPI0033C50535
MTMVTGPLRIGAAGAAELGMVVPGEPVTAARIFFVCLLPAAVVGLKATGGHWLPGGP